jgi:holin-like protein
LRGFTILLLFDFAGLGLHALGVPLPPAVLGLILFSAALFTRLLKVHWVESAGDFLLKNLLLFFVPAVAGIIAYVPVLRQQWLPITAALFVSTISSAVVSGHVVAFTERRARTDDAE